LQSQDAFMHVWSLGGEGLIVKVALVCLHYMALVMWHHDFIDSMPLLWLQLIASFSHVASKFHGEATSTCFFASGAPYIHQYIHLSMTHAKDTDTSISQMHWAPKALELQLLVFVEKTIVSLQLA